MLAELQAGQGDRALSVGNNSTWMLCCAVLLCSAGSCLQQLFAISTPLSILLGLAMLEMSS